MEGELKMDKDRIFLLEKTPVVKALMTLAIPTIVGMMIQVIYNLADTFFVGQLGDPDQVAAVSLSMPIFFLVQAVGNVFANGGASYISRALGRKDYDSAKKAASISFYSALAIGIIMSAIVFIFMKPLLYLVGASENTFGYAKDYLNVIIVFGTIMLLKVTLGGILRSEGATKQVMIGMLLGTVINIILDPLFIITFRMGVFGAAVATIIGNACGVAYYLLFFFRKKSMLSISPRIFEFSGRIYSEILAIGIPASVNMLLMSVATGISNSIAATYGDKVVAAMGIVMRTTSMAFMVVLGLSVGYQPLAGYSYGAKNYRRLMDAFKSTALIGTGISLFFTAMFLTFSKGIISIFIQDSEVVHSGAVIIRANVTALPLLGIMMTFMTTFQSMGKAVQSLIISLGRQGIFFIPIVLVLNNVFGFHGFVFAQPIADVMTFFVALMLFLHMRRKLGLKKAVAESLQLE
jgi:multidrug efflux pump